MNTPQQFRLAADILEKGLAWQEQWNGAFIDAEGEANLWECLRSEREIRLRPLDFAPIPEGAERHNPDGLTPEQVGEGYRLLTTEELKTFRGDCDMYLLTWVMVTCQGVNFRTYRVPLSTPYPDGSFVKDGKLVKTWKLTREIPGFRPLRDGEEWHCGDSSWVESDLFEGERPVLVGEIPQIGDQVWTYGGGPWEEMTHPLQTGLGAGYTKHKTRRPLPEPAPAPAKEKFYAVYEDLQPDAEPAKVQLGPDDVPAGSLFCHPNQPDIFYTPLQISGSGIVTYNGHDHYYDIVGYPKDGGGKAGVWHRSWETLQKEGWLIHRPGNLDANGKPVFVPCHKLA